MLKLRFKKALFIFRRDLRLQDNTGLLFALEHAKEVVPCFIFTPEQIDVNPYRSNHCLQFMLESLEDLEQQLAEKKGKLSLLFGSPDEVVTQCITRFHIDAVIVNRDYTPYSIKRDQKIEVACKKQNVPFYSFDDALLHPPETTLKADNKPYTIFTPYHRNASQLEVPHPTLNRFYNYSSEQLPLSKNRTEIQLPRITQAKGGRTAALKILKNLHSFSHYKQNRDYPAEEGTTHLSAHLKFTTCSIREAYHAINQTLGPHSDLLRSLYWRDFFSSIAFYFPHVFTGAFQPKFAKIKWENDPSTFKRWCEGKTGFPIIDAGMREMNTTGFMHNRVRMLVASFLVKDLRIDWRWGEKYFAQTLIDYDPAVNNGNWQWCASTGCDAQPYFRIFNPWTQQVKFDPDCQYIKKWIPELKKHSPKTIHKWDQEKDASYLAPMVDHTEEAKKTKEVFHSYI